MYWFKETIEILTRGKGLYPITGQIESCIRKWNISEGMCYLFVQHTSASLVINESYDPSARMDLEKFMQLLVPEGQAWQQHTLEGADDSPSHIRTMLTQTSMVIPIDDGRLSLGTWQGVYLFEHRQQQQHRQLLLRGLDASPSSKGEPND